MARPSKLTPEVQAQIVAFLEAGVTIENIAAAVGITDRTFYNWMESGKEAESGMYFQFFQEITRAQKSAFVRAEEVARGGLESAEETLQSVDEVTEIRLRTVQRLDENGKTVIEKVPYEYRKLTKRTQKRTIPPSADYAIKYLSRRDPQKWAETRKTEHTGADGKPIQTQQTNVTIQADNAQDASNILQQLAELGAIPPEPSAADNHPSTE